MKKFNPVKELEVVQKRNKYNSVNYMIPILVICCSVLAMIGYTFSAKLIMEENNLYRIQVDFNNGSNSYLKRVDKGSFSDTIKLDTKVKGFTCSEGSLDFDSTTGTISNSNVTGNIRCMVEYDEITKYLDTEFASVNDNSGVSLYYPGNSKYNYIRVNGMMFRIVRFNGDGSIRIILNESIISSNYGKTLNYRNSNVKKALLNWYNTYFKNKSYVVSGDYDVANYQDYIVDNLVSIDGYYEDYVGLLSVREMALILGDLDKTYLDGINGMYLGNANGNSGIWYYRNGSIDTVKADVKLSVRPVINISVDSLSGSGTINNPYTFKED